MLVADLAHFADLPDDTPEPARRLAEQLHAVVRAATAAVPGSAWVTALPCRRRPGNRRCAGRMIVRRDERGGPIAWECSSCQDAGLVSGWENSPQDLTSPRPTLTAPLNQIHIQDEVAAALLDLRLLDAESERVIYQMRAHGDDLVLTATDEALDELIGSVAAEANQEPNRRRQQRLDVAFDVLSKAAQTPRKPPTVLDTAGNDPGRASRPTNGAATALPELDIARIHRWCAGRVPEHARHQVRLECELAARHLTIVERRAPWHADLDPDWTSFPIARLRYAKSTKTWTLYWRDRNLRFHTYDRVPPTPQVLDLLTEIDRDPTSIFWG